MEEGGGGAAQSDSGNIDYTVVTKEGSQVVPHSENVLVNNLRFLFYERLPSF